MATVINTGNAQVTVLNARERVTGQLGGYWIRQRSTGRTRLQARTKREALRIAAACARAERSYYRRQRAAHAVFVQLPRAEQAALLVAMNTGRASDRARAQRLYEDLHLLVA